ncbi:MAG: hypothetical protein MK000_00170 [Anaerolineales bacterium]|nr:hypothetical protein [Anaerolineales bacterium]
MTANETRWGVVGHEWAVATLSHHIHTRRLQHAYLLSGTPSIGKQTVAVAFARALFCTKTNSPCPSPTYCRTCSLVARHKHPDVHMLSPVETGSFINTGKISIDAVRELVHRLSLKPIETNRRVAIISNFEAAARPAADAMLKTLEEPPGNTIIIITTDNLASLPSTIVSRCTQLPMRPLLCSTVERALCENWGASREHSATLARISGGRLGLAVRSLSDDTIHENRSAQLSGLLNILPASRVDRFVFAKNLTKDREALFATLDLWASWFRDVMHVAADANTPLINIDKQTEIAFAANQLTAGGAARAVSAVRTAQTQLKRNANSRLVIEVLMLEIPHIKVSHNSL